MVETYTAPPLRADPAGDAQPSDFHRGFNVIITLSQHFPSPAFRLERMLNLLFASICV